MAGETRVVFECIRKEGVPFFARREAYMRTVPRKDEYVTVDGHTYTVVSVFWSLDRTMPLNEGGLHTFQFVDEVQVRVK